MISDPILTYSLFNNLFSRHLVGPTINLKGEEWVCSEFQMATCVVPIRKPPQQTLVHISVSGQVLVLQDRSTRRLTVTCDHQSWYHTFPHPIVRVHLLHHHDGVIVDTGMARYYLHLLNRTWQDLCLHTWYDLKRCVCAPGGRWIAVQCDSPMNRVYDLWTHQWTFMPRYWTYLDRLAFVTADLLFVGNGGSPTLIDVCRGTVEQQWSVLFSLRDHWLIPRTSTSLILCEGGRHLNVLSWRGQQLRKRSQVDIGISSQPLCEMCVSPDQHTLWCFFPQTILIRRNRYPFPVLERRDLSAIWYTERGAGGISQRNEHHTRMRVYTWTRPRQWWSILHQQLPLPQVLIQIVMDYLLGPYFGRALDRDTLLCE